MLSTPLSKRTLLDATPGSLECLLHKWKNTSLYSEEMQPTLDMDSAISTNSIIDWERATPIIRSVALVDICFLIASYFSQKKLFRLSCFSTVAIFVKHVFRELFKALFGIFFLITLFPLYGPVIFGFFVYSKIVKAIQKREYGEKYVLTALDSVWGAIDRKSPPYINVVMVMDGQPRRDHIIKRIQEQIIDVKDSDGDFVYWKFNHVVKPDRGHYVWVKAPVFDINNHVRVWQDPLDDISCRESKNVNGSASTDKLEKDDEIGLISRFMDDQGFSIINPDTPQWEVVVLESSCISDNKYVAVVRLNHSLGDGTSLMRLILAKLADNPILVQPKGRVKLSPFLNFFTLLYSLSMYPIDFLSFYLSDDKNPIHDGSNTGQKVCSLSPSVSLAKMKEIKNAAGCTINDVFMSCYSGALARTFTNRCEREMTMMVPMSNHSHSVDFKPENNILFGVMRLPTYYDPCLKATDRLTASKMACDNLKNCPSLMATNVAIRGMLSIIPGEICKKITQIKGLSLGISNTPGPQEDISLWGNKVLDMAYWVPDVDSRWGWSWHAELQRQSPYDDNGGFGEFCDRRRACTVRQRVQQRG